MMGRAHIVTKDVFFCICICFQHHKHAEPIKTTTRSNRFPPINSRMCVYSIGMHLIIQIYVFYTLGRPRRRWEDNIRMDLKEIGINTRNWLDSAQERAVMNVALNLRVPKATELVKCIKQ